MQGNACTAVHGKTEGKHGGKETPCKGQTETAVFRRAEEYREGAVFRKHLTCGDDRRGTYPVRQV